MKGIRRILIINGKGGCGKTTIATNLAVAYAQTGRSTALMDYDSQASTTDWSELRQTSVPESSGALANEGLDLQPPESGRSNLPLQVIPMHRRVGMYQTRAFYRQLRSDVERVIIDTPSGARERDIDTLIKQSDIILIPMLPSPLDIRSGSRFIADLLTHRGFRANPRVLGVIANRLQPMPDASNAAGPNQQKLLHALECLNVPCVANFADSALYGQAAEHGRGITELEALDQASRAEQATWFTLVDWLESQPTRAQRTEQVAAPKRAAASAAHSAEGEASHSAAGQDNQATV